MQPFSVVSITLQFNVTIPDWLYSCLNRELSKDKILGYNCANEIVSAPSKNLRRDDPVACGTEVESPARNPRKLMLEEGVNLSQPSG